MGDPEVGAPPSGQPALSASPTEPLRVSSLPGNDQAQWVIAMGDNFQFSVEREESYDREFRGFGSYADLNGRFPTKLAAVESVISALEDTRAALSIQIARAKRMRSRLSPTNVGASGNAKA